MERKILVCTLCDNLFSTVGGLRVHKNSAHNLQDDSSSNSNLKTCAFCNGPVENELSTSKNFLCYKCQNSQPSIVIKKKIIIEDFVQSEVLNNSATKQEQEDSDEDISKECICETCGQCYQEYHNCDISVDVQEDHESNVDHNTDYSEENNFKPKNERENIEGKFINLHEDLSNIGNNGTNDERKNKNNINKDTKGLIHSCSVCNKVYKDILYLNNHLKKHSQFPHKCRLCQKEISAKIIEKSSEGKILSNMVIPKLCILCKLVQNHLRKLGVDCDFEKDDMSNYSRDFFKSHGLHPCSKCLKVFKKVYTLREHELDHPDEYLCKFCGSVYFKYHICPLQENSERSDHDNQGILKKSCDGSANSLIPTCSICDKTLSSHESLSRHILMVHKKCYNYFCTVCQIHFYTNKIIFKRDFVIDGSLKSFHIKKENDDKEKTLLDNDDEVSMTSSKGSKTENKNLENNENNDKIIEKEDKTLEKDGNNIKNVDKAIDTNGNEVLSDDNEFLQNVHETPKKKNNHNSNYKQKIDPANSLLEKYKLNDHGLKSFDKIRFKKYHAIGESQCKDPRHCQLCHKTFCSPSNLLRHLKVHIRKKQHYCENCDNIFVNSSQHIKHKCKATKNQSKTRCSDIFLDVRKNEETMCDVCGKVLSSVSALNKHSAIHGPKGHICEICGKGFHLKEYLKEHYIQRHGEGNFKTCPVCFKVLKGRNSLDSHILRFHSEIKNKEIPSFVCSDCGRVFHQKGNLHKHQLSHSNNLTFKCTLCNIFFKYPEQLRRHLLLHGSGPKYECNMCDRKFVLNFMLKKHINEYHGGIVYICKYCDITIKRFVSMKRHLTRKHSKISEWQNDPQSFVRSLATQTTHYVNIQTSGSSKDANTGVKVQRIKEEVDDGDFNEDEYLNDDQSDDEHDDENSVSERDVKDDEDDVKEQYDEDDEDDDNDESSDADDGHLLVKNKRVNKSKEDEDSDGCKFKDEDEDYQPPFSKKRKSHPKLAKHSALPVKKIKENYVDKNYQNSKSNVVRFKTEQASKLNHSIKTYELKHTQSFTGLKKGGELVKTPPSDNLSNKKTVGSKLVNFRHNQQYKDNIISSVSAINNNNNIGSPAPNINNTDALNNKMSNAKNLIFTIPFNNNHSSIMVPTNESNNIMNAIEFVDCTNLNYSNIEIVETQFIPGFEVEIDNTTYAAKK